MPKNVLSVDPDDFTPRDMRDFHDVTGVDLAEVEGHATEPDCVQALLWIILRKTDEFKSLTFDDAADVPVSKLSALKASRSRAR